MDTYLTTQPTGFVSYYSHFDETIASLSEMEKDGSLPYSSGKQLASSNQLRLVVDEDGINLEPKVIPITLQKLTNRFGVVQVGEELLQFNGEYLLRAKRSDVLDPTNLSTTPTVAIDRYLESSSIQKSDIKLEGLCNVEYRVNRRRHRLRPRWYSVKYSLGKPKVKIFEIEMETKHQKRGAFGIWYANREDRISMRGTINVFNDYPPGPPISVFVNETCRNCSQLREKVFTGPADGINASQSLILSGSETTNTSQDGGQSRTCSILK